MKSKSIAKFRRRLKRKVKKMKKQFSEISLSILILTLFIGLNWTGFLAIGNTLAYFSDTETSANNTFAADSLDFSLSETEYSDNIGLAETIDFTSILVGGGGMDFQYTLEYEKLSGSDDFCSALDVEVKLNGITKYDGSLALLSILPLSSLGSWTFDIELPVEEDDVAHHEKCEFDLVFKGWQTDVLLYGTGGFTDEERMNIDLVSSMIVLNEFLPRPDGLAYGFDFGDDSSDMPQGEWVELYNNSTSAFDLSGWYVWDDSESEANKIAVTASNSVPATATIGGESWLVVYMNKAVLNNDGDTVKLYNDSDILIDSHTYIDNDFCEIEPTPEDENSTSVSGSCAGVPSNKSYARIPDGIGGWVDPIPTPGGVNIVEDINYQEPVYYVPQEGYDGPAPENSITIGAIGAVIDDISSFVLDSNYEELLIEDEFIIIGSSGFELASSSEELFIDIDFEDTTASGSSDELEVITEEIKTASDSFEPTPTPESVPEDTPEPTIEPEFTPEPEPTPEPELGVYGDEQSQE
jgi:predicted ribosomally synthesized peptide with SipW-like signal peptide